MAEPTTNFVETTLLNTSLTRIIPGIVCAKRRGMYETYVDLVPGEWMRVRIEVAGMKAHLYVNGSEQPNLIVNDLKLGNKAGAIGLWIGPGTDAYFSDLMVTRQ